MRLLAVVQARMGSTRLPGKALKPLGDPGWCVLDHVLARVAAIVGQDRTVLAIPRGDSELSSHWPNVVYGPEDDVLERFVEVSLAYPKVDTFVRFTADCPLLDTDFSAGVIASHRGADITTTVPELDGLDTEVFTRDALFTAHEHATKREREHVTAWMKAGNMIQHRVYMPGFGPIRWSVDDESGLDFVRRIYAACELCRRGVPHHTNAGSSIGGIDRRIVLDLHVGIGGGLVECTSAEIYQERIGEQWLYTS